MSDPVIVCTGVDFGLGVDFGYSRTHYCPGWIDGDYEEMRHKMQDDAKSKFLPILRQMMRLKSGSESEHRLRVGLNWPGIVITDEPSPGLIPRGEVWKTEPE